MQIDEEMTLLRAKLKLLSASKYRRFNVLLKNEAYKILEEEAKKMGKSKAKVLGEIINSYKTRKEKTK